MLVMSDLFRSSRLRRSAALVALAMLRGQALAKSSDSLNQRDAGTDTGPLVWHTEKVGPQGATQAMSELADLYIALDRKHMLPMKKVKDDAGRTLQQVLRDQQAYAGFGFPRTLEGLLCKWNSEVCSVQAELDGGVHFQWSNKAGNTVTVPDLIVYPYVAPYDFKKRAGQTLDSIVTRTGGCLSLDDDCKRIVENLNRSPIEKLDQTKGDVTVPAFGLRAFITNEQADVLPANLRDNHLTGEIRIKGETASIDPTVHAATEGNLPDAGEAGNAGLWPLINHPFAFDGGVPERKVAVLVVDRGIDAEHINLQIPPEDNLGSTLGPVLKCRGQGALNCDHGTHVAGLIGARGKQNIWGVNPNSRILIYGLFPSELGDGVLAHAVADGLWKALNATFLDVVNMSFEYPVDRLKADPIEDRINKMGLGVLFVAAAGNDGQDKSGVCNIRPACIRSNKFNLISVVALTSAPTSARWPESNYGTSFDIAAPGELITSTMPLDRFGPLSGTSQATPLVAGAASLLYAIDGRLRPWMVRQRLMYTADLNLAFEGIVRSGRLNVQRAIQNLDQDCVWRTSQPTVLCGEVQNRSETIALRTRTEPVVIGSILRLVLNADIDGIPNYTLVTYTVDHDLQVDRHVVLSKNDSKELLVRDGGRIVGVPLTDIADFVAQLDGRR